MSWDSWVAMLTDLSPDVDIRTLDSVIEEYMLFAIRVCNGDISKAARALDIGRATLYRRLKKFPLDKYPEARRSRG